MKEWTGKITEISSKDWHDITLWSFQIEGETRWFRTAKKRVPAEVGDTVSFEERNNQVVMESVSTSTTDTPTDTSLSAPVPPATPPSTGDSNEIGARIQWQAARADACNVIVAALKMDALPWATNTAKGKKLDLLRGYIKEMTQQFLEEENHV